MTRKLFVLRHGEAKTDRKLKDFERPLTETGRHTILQVGSSLRTKDKIDFILSSSAKRTSETAIILKSSLGYEVNSKFFPDLYNAPVNVVINALEQIVSGYRTVLLIGHNPSLSYLTDYLSGESYHSLSPGQLIEFDLLIDSWAEINKGCGVIID